MRPLSVRAHYEHPISRWSIAAEIDDPFHSKGFFIYRLPEMLSFAGDYYISQPEAPNCWPGAQPEAAPEWSVDPDDEKTEYQIRFYDGLEIGVKVIARDCVVDVEYDILNNSGRAGIPVLGSCFMLWNSPPFVDRRHERTFVWVKGKPLSVRELTPTPEEMQRWSWIRVGVRKGPPKSPSNYCWNVNELADHGLIAVKSSIDDCCLGLAWAGASHIMARSTIPCIHSEPAFPQIKSGQKVKATGCIYFHRGASDELERLYHRDEENGKMKIEVVS